MACRLPLRPDTLFLGVLSALFVNRPRSGTRRRKLAIEADSTGGKQAVACWQADQRAHFHFPQLFSAARGLFREE
jgi:hypothetical protein